MDDRIRTSDADRERVAARLREHFAEGRLSSEELDERITAALSAKTFGDLRGVMADLPEPESVPPQDWQSPPWAARPMPTFRRGPRLLPLVLIALFAALVLPGAGWMFLKVILLVWLAMCVAGIFASGRLRRRARRHRQSVQGNKWHHDHGWHD